MSDSKEKILAAAFSLFLRKSYREVSVQEIADTVGMTKGALYYFFKNKGTLFREVFRRFFVSELNVDYERLSHASLYQFYHDYLNNDAKCTRSSPGGDQWSMRNGPTVNVYAFIGDALKHFPGLRSGVLAAQMAEHNAWERILRLARERGEIASPMSDEQIAGLFIFAGDGLALRSVMAGDRATLRKKMLSLWDGLYGSLKA